MRADERAAGEMLARLLPGEVKKIPSGGRSIHDLEAVVEGATQRSIAIEVTRYALPTDMQLVSELAARDWMMPRLQDCWIVEVGPDSRVKQLEQALETALMGLEALGVGRFIAVPGGRTVAAAGDGRTIHCPEECRSLLGLGVVFAYRLVGPEAGTPRAVVRMAAQDRLEAVHSVAQVAAICANEPDNRIKLQTAVGFDERHLFVWIDLTSLAVWTDFHFVLALGAEEDLPSLAGVIADEIDVVWLVPDSSEKELLLWGRDSGWKRVVELLA